MLLTERCNAMLANHTQCPNGIEENSELCKLHNQTLVGTKSHTTEVNNNPDGISE